MSLFVPIIFCKDRKNIAYLRLNLKIYIFVTHFRDCMADSVHLFPRHRRKFEFIVAQLICKALGVDKVVLDQPFIDYCDDIMDLVNIIVEVEGFFGIAASDDDVKQLKCANDIVELLGKKMTDVDVCRVIVKEKLWKFA